MDNNEYANAKKTLDSVLQRNFIQGNGKSQYRIIKTAEKATVYDGNTPICQYDDTHTEFLQFLPFITSKFLQFEQQFEAYYNYAALPEYSPEIALEKLKVLKIFIWKTHSFFRHSNIALIYIRYTLYNYFCKTAEYRYINYIEQSFTPELPDSQKCQDKEWFESWNRRLRKKFDDFQKSDRDFMDRLFSPLYKLLYSKDTELDLRKKLNNLWDYYLYHSHTYTPLSNKMTDNDNFFQHFLSKDSRDSIKTTYSPDQISILPDLKIISEVFTDYCFVFSSMPDSYPGSNAFYQYALLLTNHYFFQQIIKSCTFYTAHQSMHKLLQERLLKVSSEENISTSIIFIDTMFKDLTDNLYADFKDSFNLDPNTKEEILEKLEKYYPVEIGSIMGAEITEFQYFEQLLALELLDIITNNVLVRQCPTCRCYFITHSKRRKYCPDHKGKHPVHQQTYIKKAFPSDIQMAFKKRRDCFFQRLNRKRITDSSFRDWEEDALHLLSEYKSSKTEISLDEFISKLDAIGEKHGITPPRSYKIPK